MNIDLNKIVVAAIDKQWTKWAKDMVMGYARKPFVKIMDWMYIRYGQIIPGYLIRNQEKMQATYNVEDQTDILFDRI